MTGEKAGGSRNWNVIRRSSNVEAGSGRKPRALALRFLTLDLPVGGAR